MICVAVVVRSKKWRTGSGQPPNEMVKLRTLIGLLIASMLYNRK